MAYNEQIGNRLREALQHVPNVEEKVMFGGLCFMVNEKMCIGVVKDELMCRFDPEMNDDIPSILGARPLDFTGKRMKGFAYVESIGFNRNEDLENLIELCLEYNPRAPKTAAKKKKQ